jgi:plastocyanin
MRRRTALFLMSVPFVIALGWAAAGSVLAGDPCFHSTDRPATSAGSSASVTIGDCTFTPTVTTVPVGATVEWTNRSFQAHEVVGSNLTWGAHDKLLQSGDSIGWTFDKPGVYAYTCMLHPGMSGVVVVGAADLSLASDVETPPAAPAASETSTSDSLVPILSAAGLGLLGGALVGAAIASRTRRENAA